MSLLIVPNVNSKPKEFSLSDIKVVVDSEESNWFKRGHVWKVLGLSQIEKLLVGLDNYEIRVRKDFDPTYTASGPKDQQNKTDKFLSVFGVLYVVVKS